MTWLDAGSYFDQRARRLELEEVNRKAERLAAVRRRATLEYGPQPPGDEIDDDYHEMRIEETHRPGWRTMFRAFCCCGWRGRNSDTLEWEAERRWKSHVRYATGLRGSIAR